MELNAIYEIWLMADEQPVQLNKGSFTLTVNVTVCVSQSHRFCEWHLWPFERYV